MIPTSELPQFQFTAREFGVSDSVKQRQVRFQPQTSYGASGSSPNNYITFNFKSDGYWDPLATYLNIEVDADDMPDHCVYQLDNSAQSLIGQYIARINGVELIRLREYDEMAAFIYDLNIGPEAREARAGEGLGRNKVNSNMNSNKGANGGFIGLTPTVIREPTSWGGPFANAVPIYTPTNSGFRPWAAWQSGVADQMTTAEIVDEPIGVPSSYLEMFVCDDSQSFDPMRLESSDYYGNFGGYYLNNARWGIPRLNGEASVGTGEYYMSKYVYKPSVTCGIPNQIRSTKASFQIPLLCPIFGALATHGKLLPMELFNSLEFEFLINPYAFFTGGTTSATTLYRDVAVTNTEAKTWNSVFAAKTRVGWRISRFEICTELFYPTPGEDAVIKSRYEIGGFAIKFKNWYLGPKIKYASGSEMNSTIQVNNGFDSLNLLAFYFQPADYELYTFCRKHKRISNNLTSMQLRIGSDYIPSIPITGNAGNLRPSDSSSSSSLVSSYGRTNYVEFFVQTMKAFGKWLKIGGDGIINSTNFSLNHVGYSPAEDIVLATGIRDKSFDLSLFWENQVVPRCIYAFDLERFDIIEGLNSGTNTKNLRPFDLLLTNENPSVIINRGTTENPVSGIGVAPFTVESVFPRPMYLYIWLYYDALLTWRSSEGWVAKGRV
jgi:hypothetical protein